MDEEKKNHEELVGILNDSAQLSAYESSGGEVRIALIPRILGSILVGAGNLFYGKKPSYLKFRAVEVIARVPYHSWASVAHTLLTLFYTNEQKALELCTDNNFFRLSQENETMHVIVVSKLAREEGMRGNPITHTFIPLVFAFFYFWASYLMYLIKPNWSLQLNYLFEDHAFRQYDEFIKENEEALKNKIVASDFLLWYGRDPQNQYEFFQSVRNDELIHRNKSIKAANG